MECLAFAGKTELLGLNRPNNVAQKSGPLMGGCKKSNDQ